jgi:hypothetical protein
LRSFETILLNIFRYIGQPSQNIYNKNFSDVGERNAGLKIIWIFTQKFSELRNFLVSFELCRDTKANPSLTQICVRKFMNSP